MANQHSCVSRQTGRERLTHTHTERSQTGFFSLGVACLSEAGDESEQLMAGLFAFNYNCYEWKLTQPVWLECALLKTKAKGLIAQ